MYIQIILEVVNSQGRINIVHDTVVWSKAYVTNIICDDNRRYEISF